MKTTIFLLALLLANNMFAQENKTESVNTSFMVFSDPHFYDPSLGTDGAALEAYLDEDRKLLRESPALLNEALKIIGDSDVEFVVIPGDLTKDGTAASHKYFASRMEQLVTSGVDVFCCTRQP